MRNVRPPSARVREALRLYRSTGKNEQTTTADRMRLTYLDYLISIMTEKELRIYYAGVRRRRRAGL